MANGRCGLKVLLILDVNESWSVIRLKGGEYGSSAGKESSIQRDKDRVLPGTSGFQQRLSFVKIAAGLTTTSYRDTEVANVFTYSYRVISYPAGNEACSAAPSRSARASSTTPRRRPTGAGTWW